MPMYFIGARNWETLGNGLVSMSYHHGSPLPPVGNMDYEFLAWTHKCPSTLQGRNAHVASNQMQSLDQHQ